MPTNQAFDPNWISAIASSVTALGLALTFWQLALAKKVAQSQFEDALSKEYRDLVGRIPTKALLGRGLAPIEYASAFDELFRYIDLSNEQVNLRRNRRISHKTWLNWASGMRATSSCRSSRVLGHRFALRRIVFTNFGARTAMRFKLIPPPGPHS